MAPITKLDDLLRGATSAAVRKVKAQRKLDRSVITHDHLDRMLHGNFVDDSPRFKRVTVEDAPKIAPDTQDPDPIDMTTATQEEFHEYQQKMRAAKAARENADPYAAWGDLTRDTFYSYVTHDVPNVRHNGIDPGVELHTRIMPKLVAQEDHHQARNLTRGDATLAAGATIEVARVLADALTEELLPQAQEAQQIAEQQQQAADAEEQLQDLRDQAREYHEQGQPIPSDLRDEIKQLVHVKHGSLNEAAQQAANPTPMSAAAMEAIQRAAQAGKEAAETMGHLPSFGAGFGQGEPVYESPEQALTIAEMWANNPNLRAMAELFGRLDRDIRFQRAKRVVGGNDEIVDVEFGDNLSRVVAGELALFADPDFEDDFLVRYASQELLVFSTVGEEHAGRGPIIIVLDGSGTMSGERNIWARAISMCLLHIARHEKRDFACIEFSGGRDYAEWTFPAKEVLMGDKILEMASHFFGGGTTPVVGVAGAAKLMEDAPAFRKADLVIVGDGQAGFGDEDKRLREKLTGMGVRIFGIGIAGSFSYLKAYCEHVVDVHDFELTDPSAATAELAVHIT